MRLPRTRLLVLLVAPAALAVAGTSPAATSKLRVVAAESFWGSIAEQLGGERVEVESIVVNPATDPHAYQPTASDARALAAGKVAIVNGIDYDTWASQLLAADGTDGRVARVGLGVGGGDRVHDLSDRCGRVPHVRVVSPPKPQHVARGDDDAAVRPVRCKEL